MYLRFSCVSRFEFLVIHFRDILQIRSVPQLGTCSVYLFVALIQALMCCRDVEANKLFTASKDEYKSLCQRRK